MLDVEAAASPSLVCAAQQVQTKISSSSRTLDGGAFSSCVDEEQGYPCEVQDSVNMDTSNAHCDPRVP